MFFNVNRALHRVLLKVDENPTDTQDPLEQTRRLYANPRGRKRTPRDRDDLLEPLRRVNSPDARLNALQKLELLEVR